MIRRVCAQTINPYALTDFAELYLSPFGATPGDTSGRTLVTPVITNRTAVIVSLASQSLAGNRNGTAYTPVNTGKILNYNIYDGNTYVAQDPFLGCSGNPPGQEWIGNPFHELGDRMISASLCDQVIMAPAGRGGSPMYDWADVGPFPSSLPRIPTAFAHVIDVMGLRLRALGVAPTFISIADGEEDSQEGTSQANWQLWCGQAIARMKRYWPSTPIFVNLESWNGTADSAAVRAAQAAMVDNVTIFQGPDVDTIGVDQRNDGEHLNDTGRATLCSLWMTILNSQPTTFWQP